MTVSSQKTFSTDGWPITPQLWSMEPPETTTFEIDGIVFSVDENGGRIKAKTEYSTLAKEEFTEKATKVAEKFVDAYTLSRPKYFHLGPKPLGKSMDRVAPIIREEEEGKPANITVNIVGGVKLSAEFRLRGYDKDGKPTGDSFQTEFDENVEILRRSMADETLNLITQYFHLALRDTESLDFAGNIYKVLKALENKFKSGRQWIAKELGIPLEYLNKIGELTSANKYDKRHPPRPGEQREQLSAESIQKCISMAREVILAYFKYYKTQKP